MSTFANAQFASDDSDSDFHPDVEDERTDVALPSAPSEKAAEEMAALKAAEQPKGMEKPENSQEAMQKLAQEAAARVMQNMKKVEEEGKRLVQVKFAGETYTAPGLKRIRNEKLEDVVREITKKKTLNSMSKSQLDWECFKDKEQLEDALAVNRKDGFVKKSKFLVESIAKEKEQLKKKRRGPLD